MSIVRKRSIFQNAWVVPDLEEAITVWTKDLGVGPFFLRELYGIRLSFFGKPGELNARIATSQAGPVQIELIEPRGENGGVFGLPNRQTVPRFHHVACWSNDFAADDTHYKAEGFVEALSGGGPGARFAYFDTTHAYGCMLEIVEVQEKKRATYARLSQVCENWDGCSPVRSFTDIEDQ